MEIALILPPQSLSLISMTGQRGWLLREWAKKLRWFLKFDQSASHWRSHAGSEIVDSWPTHQPRMVPRPCSWPRLPSSDTQCKLWITQLRPTAQELNLIGDQQWKILERDWSDKDWQWEIAKNNWKWAIALTGDWCRPNGDWEWGVYWMEIVETLVCLSPLLSTLGLDHRRNEWIIIASSRVASRHVVPTNPYPIRCLWRW